MFSISSKTNCVTSSTQKWHVTLRNTSRLIKEIRQYSEQDAFYSVRRDAWLDVNINFELND